MPSSRIGKVLAAALTIRGVRQAAERANAKVVLIDGEQLADLMIDHGVGVADHKAYVVRKLDSDYFEAV